VLEDQVFAQIIRAPITAPTGQDSETEHQDQSLFSLSGH
jgi:hypothetical protein